MGNYIDPSDVSGAIFGLSSCTSGITAFAGGGQGSATPLRTAWNRVATVATAGDSVKLPKAVPGVSVIVVNRGAASMNVFPTTGDLVNALSANAAFAMAVNATELFVCIQAGRWETI